MSSGLLPLQGTSPFHMLAGISFVVPGIEANSCSANVEAIDGSGCWPTTLEDALKADCCPGAIIEDTGGRGNCLMNRETL